MSDGISPPPRRTLASTSASTSGSSTPNGAASSSFWQRTKDSSASSFQWAYKKTEQVGWWMNDKAAKVGVEAFNPVPLDQECDKAARILRMFTFDAADQLEEAEKDKKKVQKVLAKIPEKVIQEAQGLAIYTVLRTGLILSGTSGSGVVLARLPDGSWSPPSGLLTMNFAVGLAGGVDVCDVVLVLRNQKAVEAFSKPRVTMGAELAVSAGPYGAGALLESGVERSPVWAYTKSKGLYGGIQVDGNVIIERSDENARQYGIQISAQDLLAGEMKRMPLFANGLIQTILAAEGKPYDRLAIPAGKAPAEKDEELPHPRKLPPEEFDEEDLRLQQEMAERMRELGIDDPSINAKLREEDPLIVRSPALDQETWVEEDLDAPPVVIPSGPPPVLPPRRADGTEDALASPDSPSAGVSRSGSIKPPLPPRRRPVDGSPRPDRSSFEKEERPVSPTAVEETPAVKPVEEDAKSAGHEEAQESEDKAQEGEDKAQHLEGDKAE